MSDYNAIAEAYVAAWNEADPARRGHLVQSAFTADVSYRDPIMQGDGHSGIEQLIAGVQQRFPGFHFVLKGIASGFAENIRFSWTFGPVNAEAPIEGTDFAVIMDGKLARVTGFLDKVPAQ